MKKLAQKLNQFLERHQDRWYFFPAFGLVFLLLFLSLVLSVHAIRTSLSNRSNSPSKDTPAKASPSPDPTQKPQPSPTPESDDPSPSPKTSPKPSPTPKTSPTPSPKASPSPTPIVKDSISITKPIDKTNFDGTSIEIEVSVSTSKNIERVELIVDNTDVKKTWSNTPYTTTVDLNPGPRRLRAKVFFSDSTNLESGEKIIGVGGVKWDEPEPSPSPTPSPSLSPTPSPTP